MRILFIVHGFPPYGLGGTEVYTRDLARVLVRNGNEVSVFAREADPRRAEYETRTEDQNGVAVTFVNNTFRNVQSFEEGYRSPAIRRIGAALIDRVRPDVVHIQHLTCLSTDLVAECAQRNLPTFLTLHDYWLICHRGQLFDEDCRRCEGPFDGGCGRCVGAAGVAGPASYGVGRAVKALENHIPAALLNAARRTAYTVVTATSPEGASKAASIRRLSHMRDTVRHVTHVLAPSDVIEKEFLKFGIPPGRMTRWDLGIDVAGFQRGSQRRPGPLRIGFMGSLLVSKAPHLLLEAFGGLPEGSATLDIFGAYASYHGDDSYRAILEPLLSKPHVTVHGAIPHNQVPEALAELDVLVLPSVWLENSPLVIREAFAAGVPVVTSRLGGMAESVTHGVNGLLFEPGSIVDLRACLQRLVDDEELLERLRAGIPRVRTIEEDAAATQQLYEHVRLKPDATYGYTRRVAAVVLNYRTPEQTFLAVRALQASRTPIENIQVLDNGSGDDSITRLSELLPGTQVTALPENRGFSGGCNVGIRNALEKGADLVLLVNSDAIVPPETLGCLIDVLSSHPEVGVVAPVLLSRQFPNVVASMGMTFSGVSGRMRHLEVGARWAATPANAVRLVDAISGCVLLVRREVFDRIGFLDERYFFSFEDVEFCLRARRAGFACAIDGASAAYHEGGLSIRGRSARRIYFATRNHLLLTQQLPEGGILGGLFRRLAVLSFNIAYALTNSEVPRVPGLAAVARGLRDHARGQYGDG